MKFSLSGKLLEPPSLQFVSTMTKPTEYGFTIEVEENMLHSQVRGMLILTLMR